MAIQVYAYAPSDSDREKSAQEEKLFRDNLATLLAHGQDILANSEYFFCPLAFAYCSFLWIGGGGLFCLGQLMLGWQDGVFTAPCSDCENRILLTYVGGSILSGSNAWSGFCTECRDKKFGRDLDLGLFRRQMNFALSVRKQFLQEISYWEEYDGFSFSWGGNGLQPARKKRLIVKPVVEPLALDVLVEELKSGKLRVSNPPVPSGAQIDYELELNLTSGARLSAPVELIRPEPTRTDQR